MDDTFFMEEALGEARKALDQGEFPVGCVMARGNRLLVTGSRLHSTAPKRNELDHAEMLALQRLMDLDREVPRDQVVVFSTLEPCLMCYSALIINGIRRIVYAYEDVLGGGTDLKLSTLNPFYRNLHVEVVPGVLRGASAALFKEFFSNPDNDYLRGTLLAQHALRA